MMTIPERMLSLPRKV